MRCGGFSLVNVNEGNGRQTSNTIARKASGLHASLCYGASVDEREIGRESKGGEKGKREGKYEICYKNDARVSKLDEHDAVYRKNAQGRPRPRGAGHASVVGGITASRSIAGERCARFRERNEKRIEGKKNGRRWWWWWRGTVGQLAIA